MQPIQEEGPHHAPPRHPALVRAWRWRIAASSEPLPITWARPMADAVYAALTDTSWTVRGSRRLPLCLHGPDDPKKAGWNHEHAFLLPEDADGDGLIDHLSVAAAMGLDPAALRLLAATDRLVLTNGTLIELVLERAGDLDAAGHCGPAQVWLSHTPYVPPNPRPRFDARDAAKQLRSEIAKRALGPALAAKPVPVAQLDLRSGEPLRPEEFHLESHDGEAPPDGSAPCFLRLEFKEPVTGPLAFGWACHRGLGQFGVAEG